MSDPVTSVHALMAQVLADLPAVGKNSKAPAAMGGYSFRGIEDILTALKPILAKHGVFVVPRTLERSEGGRAVGKDKIMYVVDVHVEFTFYGPAGDTVEASAWGEGTDMGDKATQKAYTSAFKSMLSQVFCIADENTDSERHSVPDSEPAAERRGWWGGWEAESEMLATLDPIYAVVRTLPEASRDLVKKWNAEHGARGANVPKEAVPGLVAFVDQLRAEQPVTPCTFCEQSPCECAPPDSAA